LWELLDKDIVAHRPDFSCGASEDVPGNNLWDNDKSPSIENISFEWKEIGWVEDIGKSSGTALSPHIVPGAPGCLLLWYQMCFFQRAITRVEEPPIDGVQA